MTDNPLADTLREIARLSPDNPEVEQLCGKYLALAETVPALFDELGNALGLLATVPRTLDAPAYRQALTAWAYYRAALPKEYVKWMREVAGTLK